MASAILTITITDAPNHSLIQIRDKLLIKWNYSGNGTAQDKLNFLQTKIAKFVKEQYIEQLQMESQATNAAITIDIQ